MLDYKELSRKADEIISSFTKEDFDNWLFLDQIREIEDFLKGKPIKFCNETQKPEITTHIKKEPATERVFCCLYFYKFAL